MSIKAEILDFHHLNALRAKLQPAQMYAADALREPRIFAAMMRAAGPCAAFLSPDGEVIACAGLIDYNGTGRAVLWVLYARDITRHFAALMQKIRRLMLFYPRRRYEAHVDPKWPEAVKLAELMGFKYEGTMEQFEPDGSDKELWALVRKAGE